MKLNKKLSHLVILFIGIFSIFFIAALLSLYAYLVFYLLYHSIISGDFISVFSRNAIKIFHWDKFIRNLLLVTKYSCLSGVLTSICFWIFLEPSSNPLYIEGGRKMFNKLRLLINNAINVKNK